MTIVPFQKHLVCMTVKPGLYGIGGKIRECEGQTYSLVFNIAIVFKSKNNSRCWNHYNWKPPVL